MTTDEEAAKRLLDAVMANVPPLDEDPVAMMLGIVKPYCNLGRGDPAWRGYTRKVGMRKSRLHFDAIRARRVVRPAADAEWAGALLGQMRWPGDPDHVDVFTEAMERPIDHDVLRGPRALPLPVPKREAATYELSPDARPCCHTTGPNHHPACQEAK